MTALYCEPCNQRIHGEVSACPGCNGSLVDAPPIKRTKRTIDRTRFHWRRSICADCQYFGDHQRGSETVKGCGRLTKPCSVERRWISGGDDWCPAPPDLSDLSQFAADPFDRLDQVRLVTVHFNPCGYDRQRETYYEWLPTLGPLADSLRCYELVFDDDEPEIDGSNVIRGTREKNLMFQKEALVNAALRATPPGVKYFGWLDHDMVLTRTDWLAEAVKQIDGGSVAVQTWSKLQMLDAQRRPTQTKIGSVSHAGKGAPGGAWLADRQWLDSIGGLHPYHLVGGGDVAFYAAVSGREATYLKQTGRNYWDITESWIEQATNLSCGHVSGNAYHLFHGESRNRQYSSRSKIFARHDFDPATDVLINDDGILEWCSDKPELHRDVREYFEGRKEDG